MDRSAIIFTIRNLAIVLFTLHATLSFAATKTWTGNTNSNWNTASNWNGSSLPVNSDNIVINPINYTGAASAPVISSASSFSPSNIDVLNGGTLNIQANITTTGVITIDGNTGVSTLNFSAGTLTMTGSNKQILLSNGAVANFTGGTINTNQELQIYSGSTFYQSGSSTLNVATKLIIKGKKTTTNSLFSMSGGTTTITGGVEIDGGTTAAKPKLLISGGVFNANSTVEFKGNTTDRPIMTIAGGTFTTAGALFNTSSSYMDILISGGTLICQSAITIANTADTIRQTGGSFRLDNTFTWTLAGAYVCTGGTIIFNGSTSFSSGNANLNFNHVTINSGKTFALGGSIDQVKVAGNWYNNGGTFTPNDKPVILNGSGAQTIAKVGGTEVFYDLKINNSKTSNPQIILDNNINVTNTLTMTQGNVKMNNYTLTLGTSTSNVGTLAHTSGYLYNGNFKRWFNTTAIPNKNIKGFFPMGADSLVYETHSRVAVTRPLYISYPTTAPTTGGTINVLFFDSVNTTPVNFVDDVPLEIRTNSYWNISTSGVVGGTFNLNAGGSSINNADVNDLRLTLSASCVGSCASNAGTPASPEILRNSLSLTNMNNPFYIASINQNNSPLPVSWLNFDISQVKNKSKLNWSTSSEINNNYFVVERTKDFRSIEEISRTDGAGFSNDINLYEHIDSDPIRGQAYYRIKQVDYDGKQDSLPWKSFYFRPTSDAFLFSFYPNPLSKKQTLHIKFNESIKEEVLIIILDPLGREHFSKGYLINSGNQIVAIDFDNDIAEGIYLVTGSTKQELFSRKLIITKL